MPDHEDIQMDNTTEEHVYSGEDGQEDKPIPKDKPVTEAQPDPAAEKLAKIKAIIQKWFGDHIHGSPVSQSTPAHNHLVSKLDNLANSLHEGE